MKSGASPVGSTKITAAASTTPGSSAARRRLAAGDPAPDRRASGSGLARSMDRPPRPQWVHARGHHPRGAAVRRPGPTRACFRARHSSIAFGPAAFSRPSALARTLFSPRGSSTSRFPDHDDALAAARATGRHRCQVREPCGSCGGWMSSIRYAPGKTGWSRRLPGAGGPRSSASVSPRTGRPTPRRSRPRNWPLLLAGCPARRRARGGHPWRSTKAVSQRVPERDLVCVQGQGRPHRLLRTFPRGARRTRRTSPAR